MADWIVPSNPSQLPTGPHSQPQREYDADISNEQVLFIINKNTEVSPYSHEFVDGMSNPHILAGFVSAMASFMGQITGITSNQWKTVYGPDSTLLVEGGNWCVGAIAVHRETSEVRSKLRRVVREFEEIFDSFKQENAFSSTLLNEFDRFVRRVFVNDRLTEHSTLLLRPNWHEHCKGFEKPSILFEVTRFLYYTQNGQTLGEISRQYGYSMKDVKELTSIAIWKNAFLAEYIPSQQDILATTERTLCSLLEISNPMNLSPETKKVIGALDSRSRLSEIFNMYEPIERSKVCSELGILVNKGYLQGISTERKLVRIKECVLAEFMIVSSEYIDRLVLKSLLSRAKKSGMDRFPWLSRISISDDLEVKCIFEDGMTPIDFDYMYDSLDYLIISVGNIMSTVMMSEQYEILKKQVERNCNERWLPSLWEEMI